MRKLTFAIARSFIVLYGVTYAVGTWLVAVPPLTRVISRRKGLVTVAGHSQNIHSTGFGKAGAFSFLDPFPDGRRYENPMIVSPALSASLNAIGNVMAEAHDHWWIIASAAVALHEADPGHVADVDVLLSVADAQRILPAIGIELRPGSPHATFQSSIFGSWTGTALPVEFMADFHRRSGEAWLPVRPATRQPVEIEGVVVFVPERMELQTMLIAFSRPKDMERARNLAAVA